MVCVCVCLWLRLCVCVFYINIYIYEVRPHNQISIRAHKARPCDVIVIPYKASREGSHFFGSGHSTEKAAAFVTKGYGILRKYDEFFVCIVCVMHESSECIQDRGGPGRHVCWYGCLSSLWYSGLLLTGGCKEKQAALGHSWTRERGKHGRENWCQERASTCIRDLFGCWVALVFHNRCRDWLRTTSDQAIAGNTVTLSVVAASFSVLLEWWIQLVTSMRGFPVVITLWFCVSVFLRKANPRVLRTEEHLFCTYMHMFVYNTLGIKTGASILHINAYVWT